MGNHNNLNSTGRAHGMQDQAKESCTDKNVGYILAAGIHLAIF
jgi:hypothetical protein